jgi:hypothetical protein
MTDTEKELSEARRELREAQAAEVAVKVKVEAARLRFRVARDEARAEDQELLYRNPLLAA